ncbi:MAG: hypothetical protein ABFD24_12650 [Anaerolineaceae bacterium]|jgi:hypothetical protein
MKTSSNSSKKKIGLPLQIALVIVVLVAVAIAIIITGPTDDTVNPVPPTPTPIPTSFNLSPVVKEQVKPVQMHQTDGVIIGVTTVLAILLIGTGISLAPTLKKKQP